jgi:SRSO17 transposase
MAALPSLREVGMGSVSGLSAKQLHRVGGRLVEFASEMFESMVRKDQRRWGEVYLRGLMLDGKRKSIEPMAARLADGDEQCLQQFVNQSPWDWQPVRKALAVRMSAELGPEAWIIDDTGFPKQGKMSVGVARQYCGALGKVGSCQLGVSINAASEQASCPIDWRLFIPEEWDESSEFNNDRRAKAHLPDDVHHKEKWRLALEMIDELIAWGLVPPVVLGDGAYGDVTGLRTGLEQREIRYVLDVKGTTSAYAQDVEPEQPEWSGRGRPAHAGAFSSPRRTPRGSIRSRSSSRSSGGACSSTASSPPSTTSPSRCSRSSRPTTRPPSRSSGPTPARSSKHEGAD